MRILVHGLNSSPELVGIGKFTGEMADWLARRGHEVRIVTAPPFNPAWKVAEGYSAWCYRRESPTINGAGSLTVFRCPLWVPRNPSTLKRLMHVASFAISSLPVMFGQVFWQPSLVVVVEPTLLCSPVARMTAQLSGAISWLHIQDFELDAAFAVGMLRSRRLRRLIAAVEKKLLLGFDWVSTISSTMMNRLREKGFASERSVLFPNWVDTRLIFPTHSPSPLRAKLGIPPDAVVALYSGSMGRKQGLELLGEVADLLVENKNIQFVFCGEGPSKPELVNRTAHLANVCWLGLQPVDYLNDLMNLADIHLLPQRAQVADLVMPSKLTGMLASGRPVVACADQGSQLATAVADCGVCVPAGDVTAFARAIACLADDVEWRARASKNARDIAVATLDTDKVLARIEQEFLRIVASREPTAVRLPTENDAVRDAH